jgi:hypothetical protein
MRAHQDFSQSPFHIARMGFTDLSYSDQSWLLTKYAMIVVIGAAIISLIVLSALVRDTDYIRRYPKYFAAEVFIMAVGGALPLLFVAYCRGARVSSSLLEFGLLAVKLGVLHILLQLSGAYTHIFGTTTFHGLRLHHQE